eukprot:8287587-Alexandrium_andersonii.AAC.1
MATPTATAMAPTTTAPNRTATYTRLCETAARGQTAQTGRARTQPARTPRPHAQSDKAPNLWGVDRPLQRP